MPSLDAVAPTFVEMAHRIVWCTVATVDTAGRARSRILHPIWEYDDGKLTGWIATSPLSPKRAHIDANPTVSVTYWDPSHDTCTADCQVTWTLDDDSKRAAWTRFAEGPEPVGYDPRIVPGWDDPTAEGFGVLELSPTYLRVMPGSLMVAGEGELLTWRA